MQIKCKFCDREIKNIGGLRKHEYSCKNNPNRISFPGDNNLKRYKEDVKNGKIKGTNQYIKAKQNGLPKPTVSDITKNKMSIASKKQIWNEYRRKKHSESMILAVKNNPDSYSIKNVSGRVKTIKYKEFSLKGGWELEVAKRLDENNVIWTNEIDGFEYVWNGGIHLYFPDFYLSDHNMYIEVKGYETERDRCKWNDFTEALIVLKKDEISKLRKNEKTIFDFINNARVA